MVVHGAQVAQTDPNFIASFAHQGASRRKDLPFIVRMLKSDISRVLGRAVPALMAHSLSIIAKSRSHDTPAPDGADARQTSDQAHAHLRHLVVMRVEHEGPVLS